MEGVQPNLTTPVQSTNPAGEQWWKRCSVTRKIAEFAVGVFELLKQLWNAIANKLASWFQTPMPRQYLGEQHALREWCTHEFGVPDPGQLPQLSAEQVQQVRTGMEQIATGNARNLREYPITWPVPQRVSSRELLSLTHRPDVFNLGGFTAETIVSHYLSRCVNGLENVVACESSLFPRLLEAHRQRAQQDDWITDLSLALSQETMEQGTLLIPIQAGNHWSLLVVDCANHQMRLYDSGHSHERGIQTIRQVIGRWLNSVRALKEDLDAVEWQASVEEAPKQYNQTDCSIYTMRAAKNVTDSLRSGEPLRLDMSHSAAGYARLLVAHELLQDVEA